MKVLVKRISNIQGFNDLVIEAAKEGVTFFAAIYAGTGKVFVADANNKPVQKNKFDVINEWNIAEESFFEAEKTGKVLAVETKVYSSTTTVVEEIVIEAPTSQPTKAIETPTTPVVEDAKEDEVVPQATKNAS